MLSGLNDPTERPGWSSKMDSETITDLMKQTYENENAQSQGGSYIKNGAFPIITDILARIQREHGRLGAQQDWLDEICPPHPVVFRFEKEAPQAIEEVESARQASEALHVAHQALSELAKFISIQSAASKEYVRALELRRGFASLPDEILTAILENASYDPQLAVLTVRAATKLSHTCRRFRWIMIRTPTLWNRIDNSMPLSMVSACCDRQPTVNVEVDIDVEKRSDPHVVTEFIRIAKQHSTRWRSFDYRCSYDSDDDDDFELSGSEELKRETPGLEASSLTSLSIQHVNPPRSVNEDRFRDAVHFYSTWLTPKLSRMDVKNIIPIPFVGAASLKKLDLDFTDCSGGRFDLKALFSFFASCVTLEGLSMSFACEALDEASLPVKPFSFVHVRNLAVSFYDCPRKHVILVMDNCLFPVVSRMSLQIERSYYLDGDVPDFPDLEDVDVDDVLPSIFSSPSRFPELEDLRLNVGRLSRQSYSSIQITLPFNNLPKVKRLSLMLNPESAAKVYVLIPKGECLPSLRSLSLISCASLKAGWVTSFLGRLKAQGNFQMSQLTVTNCSWKAPPAPINATLGSGSEHLETMGGEDGPYVRVTADDLRQFMT